MSTTLQEKIAALREGDEVEIDLDSNGHTSMVRGVLWADGNGALLVGPTFVRSVGWVRVNITEVRVITPADPGCPFPIGAKVQIVSTGEIRRVTAWSYYPVFRQWLTQTASLATRPYVADYTLLAADQLELVPENPEPPVGTPVWWDGKWWIRDEEGAPYAPTVWAKRDLTKFWEFMPGAVPAATPESTRVRVTIPADR